MKVLVLGVSWVCLYQISSLKKTLLLNGLPAEGVNLLQYLLYIWNFEYLIHLAAARQTRISAACMDLKGLIYLAPF